MSGKTYALMFIGIILGGSLGFTVNLVYIPKFVDDYFPDNYRARLNELTQIYQDLSEMHNDSVSEIEGLFEENENLQSSIQALQEQYEDLSEANIDTSDMRSWRPPE